MNLIQISLRPGSPSSLLMEIQGASAGLISYRSDFSAGIAKLELLIAAYIEGVDADSARSLLLACHMVKALTELQKESGDSTAQVVRIFRIAGFILNLTDSPNRSEALYNSSPANGNDINSKSEYVRNRFIQSNDISQEFMSKFVLEQSEQSLESIVDSLIACQWRHGLSPEAKTKIKAMSPAWELPEKFKNILLSKMMGNEELKMMASSPVEKPANFSPPTVSTGPVPVVAPAAMALSPFQGSNTYNLPAPIVHGPIIVPSSSKSFSPAIVNPSQLQNQQVIESLKVMKSLELYSKYANSIDEVIALLEKGMPISADKFKEHLKSFVEQQEWLLVANLLQSSYASYLSCKELASLLVHNPSTLVSELIQRLYSTAPEDNAQGVSKAWSAQPFPEIDEKGQPVLSQGKKDVSGQPAVGNYDVISSPAQSTPVASGPQPAQLALPQVAAPCEPGSLQLSDDEADVLSVPPVNSQQLPSESYSRVEEPSVGAAPTPSKKKRPGKGRPSQAAPTN